ncbi:MAG: hypothetical protein WCP62_12170 [Planctomycetota bacterium]
MYIKSGSTPGPTTRGRFSGGIIPLAGPLEGGSWAQIDFASTPQKNTVKKIAMNQL